MTDDKSADITIAFGLGDMHIAVAADTGDAVGPLRWFLIYRAESAGDIGHHAAVGRTDEAMRIIERKHEVPPVVALHFGNAESVQVLIDSLLEIKASIEAADHVCAAPAADEAAP